MICLDGLSVYLDRKKVKKKINELVDHDYTNWDLESQHLNKNDAIILAKHIKFNKTMTSLDLRGNEIEDEGAIALADALK